MLEKLIKIKEIKINSSHRIKNSLKHSIDKLKKNSRAIFFFTRDRLYL